MSAPYAFVFGGCNLDISGRSAEPLAEGDSNPGRVQIGPGGVGRNIASNMAAMGVEVKLMTALGDDAAKEMILSSLPPNVDAKGAYIAPGERTGTYLVLLDEEGEMVYAVNDMAVLRHLTPDRILERRSEAEGARAVVLDGNLPRESIETILSWEIFAVVDGVSAIKVKKFRDVLDRIDILKCNVAEARALAETTEDADIFDCGHRLVERGVTYAVITAGAAGAYLFSKEKPLHFSSNPMKIRGATGAGDAFCAGLAAGLIAGDDIVQAARGAVACARMVLMRDESELIDFRRDAWEREKEEVYYETI